MTARDVVRLVEQLERMHVAVWLYGGWAVDALLGRQTRPHGDLDIVIEQRDVPAVRQWLEAEGYADVARDDTSAWNFVLGDGRGREVDVHVIVFDAQGNGVYGPADRGVMYPAASLAGRGVVDGHAVQCMSPEYLVKFHTGYPPRDRDVKDVSALCERFGMEYPDEYARLKEPR